MEMLWALEQRGHRDRDAHRPPRDRPRDGRVACARSSSDPSCPAATGRARRPLAAVPDAPAEGARGRVSLRRAARSLQEGAAAWRGSSRSGCARRSCGPSGAPCRSRCARGRRAWLYRDAAARPASSWRSRRARKESVVGIGVEPEKVEVMPNVMRGDELAYTEEGRRRVRSELGIPDDAFVVGCISRFHPKKRNDVVVEAVKQLDERARTSSWPAPARPRPTCASARPRWTAAPTSCPRPATTSPTTLRLRHRRVLPQSRPRARLGRSSWPGWPSGPASPPAPMGVADMITGGIGEIVRPRTIRRPGGRSRAYMHDPDRVAREGAAARERAAELHLRRALAALIEALFVPRAR